ncbi:MAG: hypothetical protein AAFX76_14085, partial [Planctomycetota bacterium]
HASAEMAADKLESLLSDCQSMGSSASLDLDGCLSLPKASLQNMLQQMSQARASGFGQGGQGGGRSGSSAMANASLIGPRAMSRGDTQSAFGDRAGGNGPGGRVDGTADPDLDPAEALNPDNTEARFRSSAALPGVPPRYRDVAAAYFRRLADEAARNP